MIEWWPWILVIVIVVYIWLVDRQHSRRRRSTRDLLRRIHDNPKWEAVPAYDEGMFVGYRVRWSEPDCAGRYLWVGHYLAEPDDDRRLRWCEFAATNDAELKNLEHKAPWDYE